MAEELRFWLRTALYSAVIAVIYWFASFEPDGVPYRYDAAGTTLLVFTLLAAGSVVLFVMLLASDARGEVLPRSGSVFARLLSAANRTIGLEHGSAERRPQPLAGGPDALPTSSPWPVLAALAATLVTLGFVFGAWLIAPGIVLGIAASWGWLTQLD